jgi:hypothetical protein
MLAFQFPFHSSTSRRFSCPSSPSSSRPPSPSPSQAQVSPEQTAARDHLKLTLILIVVQSNLNCSLRPGRLVSLVVLSPRRSPPQLALSLLDATHSSNMQDSSDDDPFSNHPPPLPAPSSTFTDASPTRSQAPAVLEPDSAAMVKLPSTSIFVEHLEDATPLQEDMEVRTTILSTYCISSH